MERRFVLAIILMLVAALLPSLFIKPPPRRPAAPPAESVAVAETVAVADTSAAPEPMAVRPPAPPGSIAAPTAAPSPPTGEVVSIESPSARYGFSTRGASLARATMSEYRVFSAEDTSRVELVRQGERMLGYSLVLGTDTLNLDTVPFAVERAGETAVFSGTVSGLTVVVGYSAVDGKDYLFDARGEIRGLEGRTALAIVGLGSGFPNTEADSLDNFRHYGLVVRRTDPSNHTFRSLDPGETKSIAGPFDWVAVKSKYFIGAIMSPDSTRPLFGGAVLKGGPRENRQATRAESRVTLPIGPDGRFAFQVYLGPQRNRTLDPLGRQLDRASPYGWIFSPIVMPVSVWITQLFVWMHQNLALSFGWVLVVFGVLVRLVLWPLNQKAMKSQVAMMAVQPILKDIQTRYKNDPTKLQQEMMKVYKEHKVNPFGGCLPLLIPFPVLLALFFVFANTIELRGAPFLWMPDLSLKDPLYVVPLVMGLSMFALSKLSMAGMPPNPQAKMMTIVMPIMMTVFFLNFASGLNLYYAVSNIVSLPQQWIINRARAAEMARRQVQVQGKR